MILEPSTRYLILVTRFFAAGDTYKSLPNFSGFVWWMNHKFIRDRLIYAAVFLWGRGKYHRSKTTEPLSERIFQCSDLFDPFVHILRVFV